MTWRLRISEPDFETLRSLVYSASPREGAAFALAGIRKTDEGGDVLVRRTLPIPDDAFRSQLEYHLELAPSVVNGLVGLCEANGLGAVLCHSHGIDVGYSPTDDFGEQRVFAVLREFVPPAAPTASLLFLPSGVTGRVWFPDGTFEPLDEIIVVGRSIRRHGRSWSSAEDASVSYGRQVLAFGNEGQDEIQRAKVAVVGVGGTGSPIVEQLARLGVQDLILVDPDVVDASSLSRMYGSFQESIGRNKVAVLAEHVARIRPGVQVKPVTGNVVSSDAAAELLDRDIIFVCTDEHWGRAIVNQISHQYLIPVINTGVRITSREGTIEHAIGIVDVLRPDLPCLWCRQFLSADRIAAESMPRAERTKLQQEGYVQGIDEPAPSVVTSTTAVSGLATSLFLQLVTDFMGDSGAVSRLNYDMMRGTVSRGTSTIAEKCICRTYRGFGDLKPLPTVSKVPA